MSMQLLRKKDLAEAWPQLEQLSSTRGAVPDPLFLAFRIQIRIQVLIRILPLSATTVMFKFLFCNNITEINSPWMYVVLKFWARMGEYTVPVADLRIKTHSKNL